VPDRPDLVLWTGNAGGVEVLVDGALLPPLGPDAVVVRDVSLQPRALLRRLLPLPTESGGVSDLASAAKLPMMPPSSR
jgi:cytoskeleton protein RodZ